MLHVAGGATRCPNGAVGACDGADRLLGRYERALCFDQFLTQLSLACYCDGQLCAKGFLLLPHLLERGVLLFLSLSQSLNLLQEGVQLLLGHRHPFLVAIFRPQQLLCPFGSKPLGFGRVGLLPPGSTRLGSFLVVPSRRSGAAKRWRDCPLTNPKDCEAEAPALRGVSGFSQSAVCMTQCLGPDRLERILPRPQSQALEDRSSRLSLNCPSLDLPRRPRSALQP